MRNMNRLTVLGMQALGLGVGAALAALPGAASAGTLSADGSTDVLGGVSAMTAVDLGDAVATLGALAATTPPTLPDDWANLAISWSGITLYQTGTAFAVSDFGNFAIAHGDGAYAVAWHGMFNYASATGDQSVANSGDGGAHGFGGWFNNASAAGDHSAAYADGGGSSNVASATGDFATAYAGVANGGVLGGSFNSATAEGLHADAIAGVDASSNNVASAIGDYATDNAPDLGAAAVVPDTDLAGTDFWSDLWNLL